ncbi:MAG TPA: LapA family protein [Acidimicrobiia bacterium]|nr:LapA family protein [Acidimicrobiia bacterium]
MAGRSKGSSRNQGSRSGGAGDGSPRARRTSMRAKRPGTRPKAKPDASSIAEPTVTATDEVLAASNAQRALSPDMPRVAWLRTQLQNLEAKRAERLVKIVQLTLIAVVFAVFVLQNADPVDVNFLIFSLNIRLIWVIFGCAALGGVAGYLIGRPEKSLRDLLPQKEKKPSRAERRTAGA